MLRCQKLALRSKIEQGPLTQEAVKFVKSRTRSLNRLMAQLCVVSSVGHAHSAAQWASIGASAKQAVAALEGMAA